MKNIVVNLLLLLQLAGCAESYVKSNCAGGSYAHCDVSSQSVASSKGNGETYTMRDNLLFISENGQQPSVQASKEQVLDFALTRSGYVVMYDPVLDVATIHRQVFNYDERRGEAILGAVLLVVGTAAAVALVRNSRSCFDRHIFRYREASKQTTDKIFNSNPDVVGSARWHREVDEIHGRALKELNQALACI